MPAAASGAPAAPLSACLFAAKASASVKARCSLTKQHGHGAVIGMRRLRAALLVLGAVVLASSGCRCDSNAHAADSPIPWRTLSEGLSYARLERLGTTFHLLKVPLDEFEIFAADARNADRAVATVFELRRETNALAAINGTFFDEHNRPLGLLMSDGKQLNALRDISWWAAVVVREVDGGQEAALLTTRELKALDDEARSRLRFALQVGPRTVADGQPIKLKSQTAARSAVCIVSPSELVLVASEGGPVEANALARMMAAGKNEAGLGCDSGVMLDGGPSTQLEVASRDLTLSVPGGWRVPNALAVRPRAR